MRRSREVLRDEGARTLSFRVLANTVYRRLAIYERLLDHPPPAGVTPDDLEFVQLGHDGLDEYLAFRPDSDPDEIRARLDGGHRCFASRIEGRLVSARWSARSRLWIDYLGVDVTLAPDEELGYDVHTAAEFRRRGIAFAQRRQLLPMLHDEGLRRSLENPRPDNRAAIGLLEKAGYRHIGVIGFVAFRGKRRYFSKEVEGARLPDWIIVNGE